VVLRIVPVLPTAVPIFASVKETDRSFFVVPLVWLIQALPPLVVLSIVPVLPTTVPIFASVKETAQSDAFIPLA